MSRFMGWMGTVSAQGKTILTLIPWQNSSWIRSVPLVVRIDFYRNGARQIALLRLGHNISIHHDMGFWQSTKPR